jgi:hypothetical protein
LTGDTYDDLIQQRDQCIAAIHHASTLWAEMARLLVIAPDKVTLDQVDQIPYDGLKDLIEQRDSLQQELHRLDTTH